MKKKEITPEDLNLALMKCQNELFKLSASIKETREKIDYIKQQYNIRVIESRLRQENKLQLRCEYSIEDVKEAANDWLRARGETEDVSSRTRIFNVKVARHIAWLILKDYGYGTQAIGAAFNKNHSSVVIGSHRTASLLSIKDKYYTHAYESINQILKTYYGKNSEHSGDTREDLPKL